METKICGRCKAEKPVSEFYRNTQSGYGAECKPCHRVSNREYYKTEHGRRYKREYVKRPEVRKRINEKKAQYRQRPDVRIKNMARWYTNHEIRAGRLKREPCALCGKPQAEAHHEDYSQPILIVWLCPDCHSNIHNSGQR